MTMSCVGVASGFPCAGESTLFAEHEDARLGLRLRGERQVHGHLVAVEVRVERMADERWIWIALPSTSTGSNAWIPRRWSWRRFRSTGARR